MTGKINLTKKHKLAISIIAVVAAAVIAVVIIIFADTKRDPLIFDDNINPAYKNLRIEALIDEVKKTDSLESVNMDAYTALAYKLQSAGKKDLVKIIEKNADNPVLVQLIFSIAAHNNTELPEKNVNQILFDSDADEETRDYILFYCEKFGDKYENIYEQLIYDDDLCLSAIIDLYQINGTKALAEAQKIIDSYDGNYSVQMNGALKVKIMALSDISTADERNKIIEYCDSLFASDLKNNESQKSIIMSYLAQLDSWESLKYISEQDDYEFDLLLAMMNSDTILEILNGAPDAEKLSVVCKVLLQSEDTSFLSPLRNNIDGNKEFYSENPELYKKASEALKHLENECCSLPSSPVQKTEVLSDISFFE